MNNFIIFTITFFASNMTVLLSSKSFIRHSSKSNKDLNVNFSWNFQIVLSCQPILISVPNFCKARENYPHHKLFLNFDIFLAQLQQTKLYSTRYFLLATRSQILKKKRPQNGHQMVLRGAQVAARPTKPTLRFYLLLQCTVALYSKSYTLQKNGENLWMLSWTACMDS